MQAGLQQFLNRTAKPLQSLSRKLEQLADDPYSRRPLSVAEKAATSLQEDAAQAGFDNLSQVADALRHTLGVFNSGAVELDPRHLQTLNKAVSWLQECLDALQESQAEIALPNQGWFELLKQHEGRSNQEPPQANPSPDTNISLDDLAALLVQLDPKDLSGLERIRTGLLELAALQPESSPAGELLQAASEKLQQASRSDSTAVCGDLLSEAGLCIDAASDTIEEVGSCQLSVVSPEEVAGGRKPETGRALHASLSDSASAADTSGPQTSPPSHRTDSPSPSGALDFLELPEDCDPELVGEFIAESCEAIDAAEAALLDLETSPQDMEAVNTVFRSFHTIKGTSAFLGLEVLSRLAHRAENLLSRIREQEVVCAGGYADLALRSVDILKEMLQGVQEAMGGQAIRIPDGYHALAALLEDPEAHGVSDESSHTVPSLARLGDILVQQGKADRQEVEAVAASRGEVPLGRALVKSGAAKVSDVAQALRSQKRVAQPDSSLRVRTEKLDRLVDMVGELVIAHSMVAQDGLLIARAHSETARKVSQAGKIVRELQDLCMSLRMIPMQALFQKMARLVRDLSRKTGKQVGFTAQGEETEIDRHMVDILGDPLVHMVRNALDHGIEAPDERQSAGKPPTGRLSLRAYHAGGNVIVELKDDGRGLDRDKIAAKAVANGLIDSAEGMSENEVFGLIFAPGFSTAEQITDVSGRGVGMDVVRRSIESLRGRMQISSKPGQGSAFTIVLPLTLAITDGMLIRVGPERFILPTFSILKSFCPPPGSLYTVAGRGEMVLLRDELMPIYRLHRLFGIEGVVQDPAQGILVVIEDGHGRCALLVDELLGQQQVVAKSLNGSLGRVQGVSGAAILGDGRVGLILDSDGLVELAQGTRLRD